MEVAVVVLDALAQVDVAGLVVALGIGERCAKDSSVAIGLDVELDVG